mgnify:CR=1 FL=1
MAAGNHEYTHYSGAAPQTDMEYQEGRRLVPQVFKKNNINFDSRVINGINFIAMETFAKENDYQFSATPPYEVLSTPYISYFDLQFLKDVEEVLDIFYNSNNFEFTFNYIFSLWFMK